MASNDPSPTQASTAMRDHNPPRCPVCDYDLSGFPEGDPPVCPECGKDPAAERLAIFLWHRGALKWAFAAGILCACCVVATILSGNTQALASAMTFEIVIGIAVIGGVAAWVCALRTGGVPAPSIYTGLLLRAITPIAVLPILMVTIWVWYVPLALSRGGGSFGFDYAAHTLGRLTTTAFCTCGLVWLAALFIGLRRARSFGRMALCAMGVLIASAFAAFLSWIAMAAMVMTLVGGDGRGP